MALIQARKGKGILDIIDLNNYKSDADKVYYTPAQQDYARSMAKDILTKKTPEIKHWTQGVAHLLDTLAGVQWQNIAGKQGYEMHTPSNGPSEPVPGPNAQSNPWTTNAIPPTPQPTPPPSGFSLGNTPGELKEYNPSAAPAAPSDTSSDTNKETKPNKYIERVMRWENEPLYNKKDDAVDKAVWDYAQNSGGFGTKAKFAGEKITRAEAVKRFNEEWAKAGEEVDKKFPGLSEGRKAALTDLTYNAGSKWMGQSLGKAVKDGDWDSAKKYFNAYVNATDRRTGQTTRLSHLVSRRKEGSTWLDDAGENIDTKERELVRVAENAPQRGAAPTPMANTPTAVPFSAGVPGTSQQAPFVQPGMSDQEFRHRLRTTPPEQLNQVYEARRKSFEPQHIEDKAGFRVAPGQPGEPGQAQYRQPGFGQQFMLKGVPHIIVQGKDGQPEAVPVAGQIPTNAENAPTGQPARSGMDALRDTTNKLAEIEASNQSVESQAKNSQEMINETIKRADNATKKMADLDLLRANQSEWGKLMTSGPYHQLEANTKNILSRVLGVPAPELDKISAAGELKQKLLEQYTINANEALTGHGTNMKLGMIERANPNMYNSDAGFKLISGIARSQAELEKKFGKHMEALPPERRARFLEEKDKWMKDNPLKVDLDGKNVYIGNFETVDDIKRAVPVGSFFVDPDTGKITRRAR